MTDLVSRVLAAIEQAERKALAVPEHLRRDRWTHPGPWVMHGSESDSANEVALVMRSTGRQAEAIAEHIAHNDPAAVLRRCAVDKALVALHPQESTDRRWECELCGPEGQNIDCTYPCDTLRLLARGYGIPVEEETTGE